MSGLTLIERAELINFLDMLPGMPRRILVTGSRTWEDEDIVFQVMFEIEQVVEYASWPITLVHGAARGLDSLANQIAYGRPRPWVVEPHPARWGLYGRAAGAIRNTEMVNLGADACFGFKLEGSRGTAHCLERARLANIPTWEVNR